jgi:hypothetical protein
MNRRALLTWLARGVAAAAAAAVLPRTLVHAGEVTAQALGTRLKGADNGELLASDDGGATWRVLARFGEHLRVLGIEERAGQAYLTLGLGLYSFTLRSADLRTWHTT